MDEIRVGDIVEYCYGGNYSRYNGTKGVVVTVQYGNPRNYQSSGIHQYHTSYLIDWEEGSTLRKEDNLKEFWSFTVKKVKSNNYDPTQCGDTDEDI